MDLSGFCTGVKPVLQAAGWLLLIFKIIIPLIIVGLGALDLGKAVTSGKDDDIKKNLSVICFDKKISFTANKDETEKKENPSMTFNLNDNGDSSVPAWLSALKNTRDAHKI